MTELARSYGHGLVSLAEIARIEALPLAYLEQLVGELRRAGVVEGVRGLHGGYRLTRSPEQVTVGEIYRVLEGDIAPVQCTAEGYATGDCEREAVCLSRSVWARVQASVLGILDATTLADLCSSDPAYAAPSLIPVQALAGVRMGGEKGA